MCFSPVKFSSTVVHREYKKIQKKKNGVYQDLHLSKPEKDKEVKDLCKRVF